jgi:hypothetical protein
MTVDPQDSDVAESTRRVRRGCYATSLILVALAAMAITASQGNLFYLILVVLAAAVFLFGRLVVR